MTGARGARGGGWGEGGKRKRVEGVACTAEGGRGRGGGSSREGVAGGWMPGKECGRGMILGVAGWEEARSRGRWGACCWAARRRAGVEVDGAGRRG